MERLRVSFPQLYSSVQCRVTTVFVFFEVLMLFRFGVYICLQFANISFFEITELRSEIPFYVSELIISVAYILFLVGVFRTGTIQVVESEESGELMVAGDEEVK